MHDEKRFPSPLGISSFKENMHGSPFEQKSSYASAASATSGNEGSASPSDSERSVSPYPERIAPSASAANVRAILSSLTVSTAPSSPQKKRRRDDHVSPLSLLDKEKNKNASTRSGPPMSATQEIRCLRKEVADMEEQLQRLESKWVDAIPDESMLTNACQAAKEKWSTAQIEQTNAELREKLTQQQFIFASLQSAILQAPLQSRCRELFQAIHIGTSLGTDPVERFQQLNAHYDKAIASTIDTVQRFTGHIASSPTPYSQTNVTGGARHTYISNIFVLELPHQTLIDVFQAVLGYYAQLQQELKRCVATSSLVQVIQCMHEGDCSDRTPSQCHLPQYLHGKLCRYAKVTFINELFRNTMNAMFSAKIVDGVAVIHSDGIDKDPLHPTPADEPVNRMGINAITLTPVIDLVTGKVCKIVVRRVTAYRYNVLPQDPLVQRDMQLNQCVFNGDLLTALVCQNLQQPRPELIEMAAKGMCTRSTDAAETAP